MNTIISRFIPKMLTRNHLIAALVITMFASVAPAKAQVSDAWKSAAIIGGSTAAGAYIGHKIAGTTGAYMGAAVGAAAGYAIDQRRRQREYNNDYYGDNGSYNGDGGYYGNDQPYGNGGYNGGYGSPSDYQNGHYNSRASRRR